MKLRSTTPVSRLSYPVRLTVVAAVVVMAFAAPIQYLSTQTAKADSYDERIAAIKRKTDAYNQEASKLRAEADSLQNALNLLAVEKAGIQSQIDLNQAQLDKLNGDIEATQKQIERNKETSGNLIVRSSQSDDVPLIVRLAASSNLADYIEGEASRISVRDTIVKKTEENKKLKAELEQKKKQVQAVLSDQNAQKQLLVNKEAEHARILERTKNDEATYQNLIKQGENEISDLIRKQQEAAAAALRAGGGGSGGSWVGSSGGYPWAGAPTNYNDNCVYPSGASGADNWGYCVRQCTSYVAWKLAVDGKSGFSGMGHAYSWWYLPGVSDPRKGDVIVSPAGGYGHVMYVEDVRDGKVYYSDYNGAGGPVSPGGGWYDIGTATNGYSFKVVRF